MRKIRIAIVDFAPPEGYLVERLLGLVSDRYEFIVTEEDPEFVLYSCFGKRAVGFDCVRIFFSAEGIIPDFNLCDYALGMARLEFGDRYKRLPLYRLYPHTYSELLKERVAPAEPRPEFCTCVVSNSARDPLFEKLFKALSEYRRVASGGKVFNNVGGRVPDKIEFTKTGRFGLAIENSSAPGYITEKITDVFAAGAVPIYFGAPDVELDFNPEAFVNIADYASLEEAVTDIIEIDQSEDRYRAMCEVPAFRNGIEPPELSEHALVEYLDSIFSQEGETVFRRNRIACASYDKAIRDAFFKPHVQASRLFRDWSRRTRKKKYFFPPERIS